MEQGNSLSQELVKKTAEDLPAFEKKSPRMGMFVKSMVWERKSHGLFDYESREISRSQFSFKQSGLLVREDREVLFKDHADSISDIEDEEDPKLLANARQVSESEYFIQPRDDNQPLTNRLWLIVRSLKKNEIPMGYKIQPNDIIKIGRVMLRVTELNSEYHMGAKAEDEEFDDVTTLKDEPENEDAWKFWWSSDETEDNPKMCPWNWTGSMRYIHFKWLQQWMDSRKQSKNQGGVYSIIWKNFDWEICKEPYPYVFEYKGKRWNLHKPYRPDDNFKTPYLILESLKNDRNSGRVVHTLVTQDDKNEYKLGRGHEADVRVINDISVSRWHMSIKYVNGNFMLNDCKSKFGTLVLIKNGVLVSVSEPKAIQIGRTVMNFEIKNFLLPDENPFKDICASKYFEREFKVPNFGKAEDISENIDMPNFDHIQNPVPHFLVHENNPVIRGVLLPQNQYIGNPHIQR